MNDQLDHIRKLLPVLNMAFQAEQLKMTKIVERISGLKQQLCDLDRPDVFDPMTTASRGGADILWETWAQDRKVLIHQEIAIAARDREAAKGALIAALSKLEAAKQIESRAIAAARQLKARRASW